MKKYIEQEAAISAMRKYQKTYARAEEFKLFAECLIAEVEDTPAADVREVQKGRWITKPYMMGKTQYCSCCDENYGRKHNYCPNCGADMRGENDG